MNTKEQKKLLKESIESQVKLARLHSLKEIPITIPVCDGMTEVAIKSFLNEIGYPSENLAYIGKTTVTIVDKKYEAFTIALSL